MRRRLKSHSALEAVRCVVEIRRTVAKRSADAAADRQLHLRIGVHLALNAYNTPLRTRDRFREASAVSEAALPNVPLSPGLHGGMGTTLLMVHRFEEAIVRTKEALDLDPNFGNALSGQGLCCLGTGQTNGAQAQILKRISLWPTRPQNRWRLAYLYGAAGRKAAPLRVLAEVRAATAGRCPGLPVSAATHLALGEKVAALDAPEKAYVGKDDALVSWKVDPVGDGLREQTRLRALVKEVEAGDKQE